MSGEIRLDGSTETFDVVADISGPSTDLQTDANVDLSGTSPALAGTVSIDVASLEPFSELARRPLSGALDADAEGNLILDLSRFDVDATVQSRNLSIGMAEVDPLLSGTVNASIDASREGEEIAVRAFSLDSPLVDAKGLGKADLSGEAPVISGRIEAEARDLAPISAIAGRALGGALTADIEGVGALDLSQLDIDAKVSGTDLRVGIAAVDGLLRGDSSAAVVAAREGDAIAVRTLVVDTSAIDASGDGLVDLSGPSPRFDGRVSLEADDLSPLSDIAGRSLAGALDADAEGSITFDLSAFDLDATVTGQNLRTGIAAADDLLRGTVTVRADAARAGDAVRIDSLTVDGDQLDASASGTIGEAANDLTFDARVANVGLFVSGFSGPLSANGTASQRDGGDWSVDVAANGPGGLRADISGSAAQDASRLDLDVNGSAPLGLANRFIEPRLIDGTARFNLSVNGPPTLDSVSGTVTTNGARFVAPTLGITLRELNTTVGLSAGRATVDADARVLGGGRISVDGGLGLSGAFPADLAIALRNVALSDPNLYDTSVDGTVNINGGLTGGARISGALTLDETELRIPSTGLTGVGDLPGLVHINEPAAVRDTRRRAGLIETESARGAAAGPSYPLDLVISAPNRIFLRGRGLDAELGGQIRLLGTTQNIIPSGQFDLIRGRLDILGQRLTLDEARASLEGNFIPVVRLVAGTQSGDTLIRVVVEGEATSPEVLFLSDPDLPQDEVLARLLFGRSIEDISPLQAAQLASAVATLAGNGGGVLSNLRQNFGLDDLDVTTEEGGGAAVRAGKYISDNVYTDVTVGSEGDASVSINLDLTPSVTVRGSVGSEGNTGVGVFFEKDY